MSPSLETTNLTTHLTDILAPASPSRPALSTSVLPTLIHSIAAIARTLRSAPRISTAGSSNAFGDAQLNVDVLAESIIRDHIKTCPSIITASSEEDPVERAAGGDLPAPGPDAETYTIAFDPLDGSSIIAPNWTVGTIIGVWDGATALRQAPGARLVAAVLGVYGPRTTVVVAVRCGGVAATCFEVGLDEGGGEGAVCEIVRPEVRLLGPPFRTRYFAPGNLRAAAEDEGYAQLVAGYIKDKYTLRYSGGLVPDVVHALVKGHGIYVSPVTAVSKAKLRRLYELTPIALIMECSGGMAIDPVTGEDVLAREIENCDERAGLVCGTNEEGEKVKNALCLA